MTVPEWIHTVTLYYTVFQLGTAAFCTWLYQVLPPPSDIGSNKYKIFYGVVERIGLAGRKQWTQVERRDARTDEQQNTATREKKP